jgi:hypothetical protein
MSKRSKDQNSQPESPLEELRRSGDLAPATRNFKDLPPPLPLRPGEEPPSKVLERLRADER